MILNNLFRDSAVFASFPLADPGFPVAGGRQPPMRTLFGENVCENERIGSRGGGAPVAPHLDPPMISQY